MQITSKSKAALLASLGAVGALVVGSFFASSASSETTLREYSGGTTEAVQAIQASAERLAADAADLKADSGAIAFPAGTTYGAALREIFLIQKTGKNSMALKLVPSLSGRAVADTSDIRGKGVVVDLSAPYGFDPERGWAYPPIMTWPEGVEPSRRPSPAGPWDSNASLAVPILPECMTEQGSSRECTNADTGELDASVEAPQDLP